MTLSFDTGVKMLAVALSMAWGVLEGRFARRNRRCVAGSEGREQDQGSFGWIVVSIVAGMNVAAIFAFSGVGAVQHPRAWQLSGALVMLVGIATRLHAIKVLASQFTSRVTILDQHQLVRRGLYRYVRHPSYLGQVLILVGLGALMANVFSLLTAPFLMGFVLRWRIRLEERAMAAHFGADYQEYRKHTWALLPPIW